MYLGGHKAVNLITEGPYSICRNPLYLGTFLITLSIAAFVHSAIFAVGTVLASLVYLMMTLSFEEKWLRQRLGDEYIEYCRRVPRFWPRLSNFHTRPTIEADAHCLFVEFGRALRWMAIPLAVQLIAHFHWGG